MIVSIRNAVNTRLFGAYEPQKIILIYHITQKAVRRSNRAAFLRG